LSQARKPALQEGRRCLYKIFTLSEETLEKFVGAGSPSYKKLGTFHGFKGVPKGREELLRKVRRGWKPLLEKIRNFSWFPGCSDRDMNYCVTTGWLAGNSRFKVRMG
jgi:hypothetical protein